MTTATMLFFVGFLLGTCLFKDSYAGADSQGHEFVFSIPADPSRCSPNILLTGATTGDTLVNISIPALLFSEQYSVNKTDITRVQLPYFTCITSRGLNKKSVIVSSTRPISVHAFNSDRLGDGLLAIPTSRLGSLYYIASYPALGSAYSFFAVSSVYFKTTVDITPRDGNPITVTLDPYETYAVLQDDPTGTRVRSDHKISVVAGSQCSEIPHRDADQGCESLLEQLPSVEGLGRRFLLGPFKGRSSGYICRIIAVSESPTTVHISTNLTIELNSGDMHEIDVPDQSLLEIASDNPILLMQYLKSYETDKTGDPSMVLIPPIEYYSTNIDFPVAQISGLTNYVNVAIACAHKSNLYFDGESVADWEVLVSANGSMCMLRRKVESGLHHLVHQDNTPFHATVYGYTNFRYYAYPAAINLHMASEDIDTSSDIAATKSSKTTSSVTTVSLPLNCPPLNQELLTILMVIGVAVILLFLVFITIGVALLCKNRTNSSYQAFSTPSMEMTSAQTQSTQKEELADHKA